MFLDGLAAFFHGILGCTGTFKSFLKLGHVLHRVFVCDNKNMKETVADETTERGKRRERPDDLKDKGRSNCDTEQNYQHASPANDIPSAMSLNKHPNR